MAEEKKSVLIYCDLIHTVRKMRKEDAGELFLHLLEYVNDLNPTTDNMIVELTFEPIKQQLKRDLLKWDGVKTSRAITGKLGGIKSGEVRKEKALLKQNEANEANALKSKQNEANEAVTVNVIVNDIVTVINKKESIDSRKLKFASTLEPFLLKYGKAMLNKFYGYWTEPNKSNTKFRQELEKTWLIERRLENWSSNGFESKTVIPVTHQRRLS